MRSIVDPVVIERSLVRVGAAVMFLAVLTGFATFLVSDHGLIRQLTVLTHVLGGVGFVLLLVPYIYIHFTRTAFFRRPAMIASGLTLAGVLALLAVTGLATIVEGRTETNGILMSLHFAGAILFLILILLHLIDHYFRMPARRREQGQYRFLSVDRGALIAAIVVPVVTAGVIWTADVIVNSMAVVPASATAPDYEYVYGEHPFRPGQTETVDGGFVHEAEIGNSQYCLGCHGDIGRQWMASVHRHAANDPAYVTNLNLLLDIQGMSATRYCEGCHAPVALMTGQLSPGGKHSGIAGTPANVEGVNCMGCHGIASIVHLKGVASYEFAPRTRYLFQDADSRILRSINHLLVRVDPMQHKRDLARPHLGEPELCATCHVQFMDQDMNGWGWVKMQDEYTAWLNGPFSKHEEEFSNDKVALCRDCHMPLVAADDPSANGEGMVRSHFFAAANTFLPKMRGDLEQLERVVNFLQANNIRVTIDKPNRKDSRQDLRPLDERIRGSSEAPFYAYLGEHVKLDLIVSNQGVGHDFPGGTIDLGEGWVDFSVVDAQGTEVFRSGAVNEHNQVEDGAHVYKSIPVSRDGQQVWRHDLFNMIGESFRRVIPAGESDLVSYDFDVPAWAKSPLTVTATVRYRKLNEKYAAFGLGADHERIPIIDMAWDSFQLPLRVRTEIDQTLSKL